ncbi:S-layer homology domain-containing protein [Intestinimonas butyriciproducens]
MEKGITGGTGGGKFFPNAPCTRAQMVQILKISNQEFYIEE